MATITGTNANDKLYSGFDDDEIFGLAGNDTIYYGSYWGDYEAAHGDDMIDGGMGADTLRFYSGVENDRPVPEIFVDLQAGFAELEGGVTLTLSSIENVHLGGYWGHTAWGNQLANHLSSSDGYDELHGGAGNDTLDGGYGQDSLHGDGGNDTLLGGYHDDTLFGGADNDTLDGGPGSDMLNGEGGIDMLTGGDGDDTLTGGDGSDTLNGGSESDTLSGDGGTDTLLGMDHDDTLLGGDQNDMLDGGAGNDTLHGDAGNDTLVGGLGDDALSGDDGIDKVTFVTGSDVYVDLVLGTATSGELGADVITAVENVTTGHGDDWIGGSDLANVLLAGEGDDGVQGRAGNDQLEGGSGGDTLHGGDGADVLLGGADNDALSGGGGNDTLNGGSGFDTLEGGAGVDTLTGFHHADDFVFAPGESSIGAGFRDIVTDFSTVQGDDLDLTAFGGLSFVGQEIFSAPDQVRFIHSGGNTLVQLNTVGNSGMEMEIQLTGIVALQGGDFIL